jgi:hypothetical protein
MRCPKVEYHSQYEINRIVLLKKRQGWAVEISEKEATIKFNGRNT